MNSETLSGVQQKIMAEKLLQKIQVLASHLWFNPLIIWNRVRFLKFVFKIIFYFKKIIFNLKTQKY
jgi:hypothetical protein